ncbi:hypothetical protein L3X38_018499 [Prunus dulcis]|uniref:RNase H type-1 domain-containing protein n=1 Tax=Prunus dulcis TaxID=3755 RepID=A0AAD4WBV2_PRUDU|nr:hypothetical protein L3X38_018499 [Prunus dulcis]
MNAQQIRIHSDSQLIVNQVTADFAAKDASMHAYLSTAHQLLQSFQAYEIKQIPRGENSHADALARLASAIKDKVGRKVPVEILAQPSTVASETCTVRYEDTWISHIYLYLTNGMCGDHSFGRSITVCVATIPGPDPSPTKPFGRDTFGLLCTRTLIHL